MIKTGLRTGVLAALASGAVMLALRSALDAPSLPEVLVDLVTKLLPLRLFAYLIAALDGWAKPALVASLAFSQLLVGGLLGVLWTWGDTQLKGVWPAASPGRSGWLRWPYGIALSALLWLVAMLVLVPAAGKGLFGARSGLGLPVSSLLSFLAYGAALVALSVPHPSPTSEAGAEPSPASTSRRRLVRNAGIAAAGVLLAAAVGRLAWAAVSQTGRKAAPTADELSPEVTPNSRFYTVSKNIDDPSVNSATWRLTVDGLVDRPLALTYEQLKALPAVTQYLTLECISNEVGGDLMGNALWTGVPLGQLLRDTGIKSGVRKVVLHAADDYSDSITLDKALEPGTILAYEMNGVPLPDTHGHPARLLVPGIYGMKNVKWLTRIELVDYDYQGYWQQREWSDSAVINTMSRIDAPIEWREYRAGEIAYVGGVAFAGDRGIAEVEVSTDGGKTWAPAQVKAALSPYTWVLWTREWSPPGPGSYTLKVRARDRTGRLQSPVEMEPLPDGATGYHTIVVRIVEE